MSLAIIVGTVLVLFALSLFSKRRFGLLGLGLAAGSILSSLWIDTAEFMVSASGVIPAGVMSKFVASMILLLLPALVLLFKGYSYKTLTGRLVGSLLFTVLALAFLANPMAKALILDGPAQQIVSFFIQNGSLIIGAGLMLAVFDIFVSKSGGGVPHKSRH